MRDVEAGEELSYDYNYGMHNHELDKDGVGEQQSQTLSDNQEKDSTHIKCYCGAHNCRKWLWRPPVTDTDSEDEWEGAEVEDCRDKCSTGCCFLDHSRQPAVFGRIFTHLENGSRVGQRAASCKLQMPQARWMYVELSVLKLAGFETPFEIHSSLVFALSVGQQFWTLWVSRSGFHGFGTPGWRVTIEGSDRHPPVAHESCWVCNQKLLMINPCYNIRSRTDRYLLRILQNRLRHADQSIQKPLWPKVCQHLHPSHPSQANYLHMQVRPWRLVSPFSFWTVYSKYAHPAQKEKLFQECARIQAVVPSSPWSPTLVNVTSLFEFQFWCQSLLFVRSFE